MGKRVLVLSTSAGSGHKSAAAALEQLFRQAPEVDEVINLDALELTNETYRSIYSDAYLNTVKDSPWLVGWLYDFNDAPFRTSDTMRQLFDWMNNQPLVQLVMDFAPDITVCTHFMPAGIVAQLVADGRLNTSLSIVTTDYDFQGMWLSKTFHRYFVALEEAKVHLVALGLPPENVTASGIPVNPLLGEPVDRETVLATYGLNPDLPILLVSAGAVGGGPAREVVSQLMLLRNPFQAVVICGKNADLRREIEAMVIPQAQRFRVLGFTDTMPDLLRVASLFIGKPGGLTASECMACGLPMLIVAPIPGQEERNSDHLLELGAAIRCNQLTTLAYKIDRLLEDPDRLATMRLNARTLGRPDAAHVIVDTLLNDEPAPVQLSLSERRQIAEVATSGAVPTIALPRGIGLYDDRTGILVGVITDAQLVFLQTHLEEEGDDDDDYYVNEPTVELLRRQGADSELIAVLSRAVAVTGEADLRWAR